MQHFIKLISVKRDTNMLPILKQAIFLFYFFFFEASVSSRSGSGTSGADAIESQAVCTTTAKLISGLKEKSPLTVGVLLPRCLQAFLLETYWCGWIILSIEVFSALSISAGVAKRQHSIENRGSPRKKWQI